MQIDLETQYCNIEYEDKRKLWELINIRLNVHK